ncbi:MAG: amidase [Actinomycetota bacterium]|nr:amidase [Actinomycetota bacterium]
MDEASLYWMSATELLRRYRKKEVSPVEVTRCFLNHIDEVNPRISALVTVTSELAMDMARSSEKAYMRGHPQVLEGIPITIKDLISTKGIRTTLGSLLFADYVPEEDAVVVERIKSAGAVILGKTNVPEFGLVAVTDNVLFGPARNPWNLAKTTGGSSGGAAGALAAGIGPLALGNDGGGSIRIPASLCGVVGLKPQFGRVPSYPHIVRGWETTNCEGPMARTVEDVALLLDVIAGPDDRDRFSLPACAFSYRESLDENLKGLKIAYACDLATDAVEPEVIEITKEAAHSFEKLGCEVVEENPNIPSMAVELTTMVVVEMATALQDRIEEAKEKIYPLYRPFLEFFDSFSAADFAKIEFKRQDLWDALRRFFEKYDLLLTPTTACPAFDIKEEGMLGPDRIAGKEVSPASWVSYTFPFNFTGQPAISVPCGFTAAGLPVGLQIVGKRYDELRILNAAKAFEAVNLASREHPRL